MISPLRNLLKLTGRPANICGSFRGVYYFAGNTFQYLAKTVNLPFLADSINEGTVAKILKSKASSILE